jgi:hypothetical protein
MFQFSYTEEKQFAGKTAQVDFQIEKFQSVMGRETISQNIYV